ncbi:MAG: ANTAR domain-containing protein [Candidatus Margulisiibacteriota bacterium]
MLTARQEQLLGLLKAHTYIYSRELVLALDISRARLNQLLASLLKNGLVLREGRARSTRYRLSAKKRIKPVILERENYLLKLRLRELETQLEDRKIIEQAKEILMTQFKVSPMESYRKLQEQSMSRNKPIAQIARAIVFAYESAP